MEKIYEIEDIFSILHDGTIESCSKKEDSIIIKISCKYLAEIIDKTYEYFYVELFELENIEFTPWINPVNQKQIVLKELEDIFKFELDILSTSHSEENLIIACNQGDTEANYCGGELKLKSKYAKVFDDKKNEISIEILKSICHKYWSEI